MKSSQWVKTDRGELLIEFGAGNFIQAVADAETLTGATVLLNDAGRRLVAEYKTNKPKIWTQPPPDEMAGWRALFKEARGFAEDNFEDEN